MNTLIRKLKKLPINAQILITAGIILFLLVGTGVIVLYGKGYRFSLDRGKPEFAGTGLLVTTSIPDGAQVFINNHLSTATNNTINLPPGEYQVKIFKEGYFPWEKTITVQKEVVSKAEALLFPNAPKLESITSTGVQRPTIDPAQTRIAYSIASQSARKNGLYVLDMNARPILALQSGSTQVVDDTIDQFSTAEIEWSPDGQEILASISGILGQSYYLLRADGFNQAPRDVTATIDTVRGGWEQDQLEKERARLSTLKSKLRKLIQQDFTILAWSPDETKILYQASLSATLPYVITPRLIGTDLSPEDREIKENSVYVYDSKEDKNYKLNVPQKAKLMWLPTSRHLLYVYDKKIDVLEYDGKNQTTIYAGPFTEEYVFPWPNASKVLILTNLGNPNILPNLYTIGLK